MSSVFIPHQSGNDPKWDAIATPDDYYPALSVGDWRAKMRVDDNVSAERSHTLLTDAQTFVQDEAAYWRGTQKSPLLTGIGAIHYRQAVYHRAKAFELEQYRDIDSTASGQERAEGLESRIDTALQRSREHLRALIGKGRATIKLI